MATIRAYTTIEQSRMLAKILPLESADMHYGNFSPKGLGYENTFSAGLTSYIKEIKVYEELKESYKIKDYNGIVAWRVIPCWSLAALLDVLPNYQLQTQDDGIGILCSCKGNFNIVTADNPVDACYEMILKLHDLKEL